MLLIKNLELSLKIKRTQLCFFVLSNCLEVLNFMTDPLNIIFDDFGV